MACRYSIELREFVEDPLFTLFDFDYPFYSDDLSMKEEFENRFIEHYYFHEIGFETVARFKHYLRSKLRDVMPYYSQLYESELKAKDLNFLLNKDLREEFIRESSGTLESSAKTSGSNSMSSSNTNNSKVSSLDNGVAAVNLSSGNLTGVSQDTTSANASNQTESGTTQANKTNQNEKTVFTSQGNIGVVSSANLLKEWRDVMINIQLQLIEECHDLFMLVY